MKEKFLKIWQYILAVKYEPFCKHEYIKLIGSRFDKNKKTYVLVFKCEFCSKEFKQIE